MEKNNRILIVGGGTFGLSAAYHLARTGYTAVTVLDKGNAIPAPLSAANDINKIVRAEYTDPFYSDVALDAMAAWVDDPVFAPHYHQTGYLLGVSGATGINNEHARHTLSLQLESLQNHPAWAGKIRLVRTRDDLQSVAPTLDGAMPGWSGYFNTFAGYAHAANAMRSIYRAVLDLGVHVELGQEVASLRYDTTGTSETSRCVGVTTKAGARFDADVVVLTVGGSIGEVLPTIGQQIVAKAWAVAHLQLTPDEAARLRGIPVTFMRDLGFFFEPEPGTGLFKICAEGAGFSNFGSKPGALSVAATLEESAFLPAAAEKKMRALLADALPALADRPFIDGHVCWCADSADSDYVIDYVPNTTGLIVATGDSGHGFKMLPVAGKWIKDVLEKGQQDLPRWRWKEGNDARVADKHRTGELVDLKDARPQV